MASQYVVTSTIRNAILGAAGLLAVGVGAGTVAAGDDSRIVGAVQASTLTTNGDLLTRAAGVPARLGVGSDGQILTVTSGAPVWAAAGSAATIFPSTSISLASATGWSTTTAGGTTSVIDTGTQRAVLTVAAATATYTLASVARTTLPALGRWSIQARITSWTGVAATDTEQMLVRLTNAGGTFSDLWIYGTEAVSLTAGATVPGGAITVVGLLAGQGWVRATVDGSQITYACGVGSGGAAPTSWTTIGSRSTATAIMHPYTSFGVQIRRTVSQVTDLVAELGTVSYRSLEL